jgi:internalin A
MFKGTGLTSITIPDTVADIGDGAFQDCANLKEINLGNELDSIGDNAFNGTAITYLKIPGSVTGLGGSCFSNTKLNILDIRELPARLVKPIKMKRWGIPSSTVILYGQDINLSSDKLNLKSGDTQTITYNAQIPDGKNLTWGSINPDVATVSENGEITAVSPGTSFVYATTELISSTEIPSTIDPSTTYSGLCKVTVTGTDVKSSNADLSSLVLSGVALNENFDPAVMNYTASVGNEVANTDITAAAADAKSTIKVSVNGEDVSGQQASLNVGENDIKVEVTAEDGTVKTYNITVTRAEALAVPVTDISLDKTSTTIQVGSTEQLTPTVSPENATNKNVTWTSDKTDIAIVDEDGVVTGVKAGTATITAAADDGNKTAACTVTITDNSETNPVDITTDLPEDASFKLGSDAKVTVNAVNNSDEKQPVSLILALFNKANNAFVTYTAGQQDVESKGSTALTGGIKLPDTGNYELKAFVWDGLDEMKPLSDVKTIPVVSDDTPGEDVEVTFADWGLEEAVRDSIGKPDGILYKSDVDKIIELDVTGKNILDLGGIENLTSLETLNLKSNKKLNVDTISKLNELPNLKYLDLSSTPVDDLSVLSGLIHLQSLKLQMNCKYNGFANVDGLKSLTNLKELDLSDNIIDDVNGLKDLTNLEKLSLEDTGLKDISTLSGLTNLQYFNLNRNDIEDISSLSGLTDLQYLDLGRNPVSNISALSKLTNLQTLLLSKYSASSSIHYDKISDISALSGLKNLTTLDLSYNQVSDISALAGLIGLTDLNLGSNQISDITPFGGLTDLQSLDIGGNSGITDVNTLKGLTNLKSLVLYGITIDDDDQQDLKNALPNCNIAF